MPRTQWLGPCIIALALLAGCAATDQPNRGDAGSPRSVPGRVIVKPRNAAEFRANTSRGGFGAIAGFTVVREIGGIEAFVVESREQDTRSLLATLNAQKEMFEYAEPDFLWFEDDRQPNDTYWSRLWGMRRIAAPAAWDTTTEAGNVVVGVVDSGVAYNHSDLELNMWSAPAGFSVRIGGRTINCPEGSHGYDAVQNDCTPSAATSHGTHVAGTIGAIGNNRRGVVGVNWRVRMMALRFIGSGGSGRSSDAIDCLEFARQARRKYPAVADIRVLNNSWGGGGRSRFLLEQIQLMAADDILFVAAAGNNEQNNDQRPHYPSSYTEVETLIGVAASTQSDRLAGFSNFGRTTVHLAAPGTSIYSTLPSGYGYKGGTSMATPHVAGAAALVAARCSAMGRRVKAIILQNIDSSPYLSGKVITGGRLNVAKAIEECGT